jgi:hypothetical protein
VRHLPQTDHSCDTPLQYPIASERLSKHSVAERRAVDRRKRRVYNAIARVASGGTSLNGRAPLAAGD